MKEIYVRNKNNTFQKLIVLKTNRNKRYKYNEFLVEGVRNINEAVKNGWRIQSFIYNKKNLSNWAKDLINSVKTEENYNLLPELLQELSGKEDTSELMAVVKMNSTRLSDVKLSNNPLIVLFDRPSNKGNLGTIMRSCDALGVDVLILTGHSVDMYDPDVVVSSMGSFFNLQVIRIEDNNLLYDFIDDLKQHHPSFLTIGTTAHKEKPIFSLDLSGPVLLMLGNETMGLNKSFKEFCDILCSIPMSENSYASSFNVGCAGSIMLYEIIRQRISRL